MTRHWLLLTLVVLLGPAAAWADDTVDVYPPLTDPRLHFHTGAVVNNQPEISPLTPDLPSFQPSPWFVAQWQQESVISADMLRQNDPAARDRELGVAHYAFTAPDGHSHVWIFTPPGRPPVFELFERGGVLMPGGSSNLFLSTKLAIPPPSFDRVISFDADTKLAQASITYDTSRAQAGSAVLGMAFAGFSIELPQIDGQGASLFLQTSLANARSSTPLHAQCTAGTNGHHTIIIGGAPEGVSPLGFEPGASRAIHYRLNDFLCAVLAHPIRCAGSDGPTMVDLSGIDPAQIKLRGMYIGLETNDHDGRPRATDHEVQGSVAMALQVSDLRVQVHTQQSWRPDCGSP